MSLHLVPFFPVEQEGFTVAYFGVFFFEASMFRSACDTLNFFHLNMKLASISSGLTCVIERTPTIPVVDATILVPQKNLFIGHRLCMLCLGSPYMVTNLILSELALVEFLFHLVNHVFGETLIARPNIYSFY